MKLLKEPKVIGGGVTEGESRNRGTLLLLRECWSYRRGRQSRPFPIRVILLEHS